LRALFRPSECMSKKGLLFLAKRSGHDRVKRTGARGPGPGLR
jgi:hypothetical protein